MAQIMLEDISKLSEALQAEYEKKADGKFYLKLEGETPEIKELKTKVTEFRDNNIKVLKERDALDEKLKGFTGMDPDEYKKAKERIAELEKLGAGGGGGGGGDKDFDAKVAEAVRTQVQTQVRDQVDPLNKKVAELTGEKEKSDLLLKRTNLETDLRSVATKSGIADSAVDDFIARGVNVFDLDGKAMKGEETIWSVKNPAEPMPMEEWADQLATDAPHLFKKNSGGGAGGDGGGGGGSERTISSNDPIAFGENLEKIAKGEIKVNFGR